MGWEVCVGAAATGGAGAEHGGPAQLVQRHRQPRQLPHSANQAVTVGSTMGVVHACLQLESGQLQWAGPDYPQISYCSELLYYKLLFGLGQYRNMFFLSKDSQYKLFEK